MCIYINQNTCSFSVTFFSHITKSIYRRLFFKKNFSPYKNKNRIITGNSSKLLTKKSGQYLFQFVSNYNQK